MYNVLVRKTLRAEMREEKTYKKQSYVYIL